MERDIIKIDEELCTGCGDCVPNCHEGALQVIDGKIRLISELMCDGLGACIGHCPEGAITIEKREAQPYEEVTVMKEMVHKGKNIVIAHLKHLKDHNEMGYLNEGVTYLKENKDNLNFNLEEVIMEVNKKDEALACGCPGTAAKSFQKTETTNNTVVNDVNSELTHWPLQLHLVNPNAPYYNNADVLLSADCVAYSIGDFHRKYLKGKSLAIACPKLDSNTEVYIEKIIRMIDEANINTLTVMIMEVPCCGGLIQMTREAVSRANRKVPVKELVVSCQGDILSENWI